MDHQPTPTAAVLKERARCMFVDRQSGLTVSGADVVITEACRLVPPMRTGLLRHSGRLMM